MDEAPWYRDGLRFACTRCGNCCRGAPGTVRVSDAEIEGLARLQGLSVAAFREAYTRALRGGEIALREHRNGDCVFWADGRGCTVYAERPRQCRTWPFWSAVVHSPERWREEARDCPGIDHGPLHDAETIRATAATDGTAPERACPPAGRGLR